MREETRRKLDEFQKTEGRFWTVLLIAGCVMSVLFGAYQIASNTTVKERAVAGTMQRAIWRVNCKGSRYPDFQVRLDEGSLVRVDTTISSLPTAGSNVALTEKNERQATVTTFGTASLDLRRHPKCAKKPNVS